MIAQLNRRFHTLLDEQAGSSVLEFALVLLVLLTLTFGMADLGRAAYASSVVQAAVQEGARVGMIDVINNNSVNQGNITAAIDAKMVALDTNAYSINVTGPTNDILTVAVSYDLSLITPLVSSIVGQTISLDRSTSLLVR